MPWGHPGVVGLASRHCIAPAFPVGGDAARHDGDSRSAEERGVAGFCPLGARAAFTAIDRVYRLTAHPVSAAEDAGQENLRIGERRVEDTAAAVAAASAAAAAAAAAARRCTACGELLPPPSIPLKLGSEKASRSTAATAPGPTGTSNWIVPAENVRVDEQDGH